MKVYRYELQSGACGMMMPEGATFLHVGIDRNGNVALWALVDPTAPEEPRRIVLVMTGEEAPGGALRYIGSAINVGGWMSVHVFEQE